jgi:hypothetical protein
MRDISSPQTDVGEPKNTTTGQFGAALTGFFQQKRGVTPAANEFRAKSP